MIRCSFEYWSSCTREKRLCGDAGALHVRPRGQSLQQLADSSHVSLQALSSHAFVKMPSIQAQEEGSEVRLIRHVPCGVLQLVRAKICQLVVGAGRQCHASSSEHTHAMPRQYPLLKLVYLFYSWLCF